MKGKILFLTTLVFCFVSEMHAAYLFKNGKFIDAQDIATASVEQHYAMGIQALKEKNWEEAMHQFRIVSVSFPDSSFAEEAEYFLGVAYFHTEDIDLANQSFSSYLNKQGNPKYFEETFRYKLACANAFKNGAKRHLFGSKKLPCILSGKEAALKIYEEIAASLPNHELAAEALLSKGDFLKKEKEYRSSIESYQTVIKKFPKSEFASKSYTSIADVFLEQARLEEQNPDLLSLAEINAKKFGQDFPRDISSQTTQDNLLQMKEIYANGLYETGLLYERKKKPKASVLYYYTAISEYPDTKIASLCKERIKALESYAKEIDLPQSPF